MTKKDYVLIAEQMKNCMMVSEKEDRRGIALAIAHLTIALERDNSRFNREKFLEACRFDLGTVKCL